ncbi:MAG: aspartate 1-decarboxylase, partial [Methylococcales bacterium]|nr:aspartate 1-decarboxylase [Methylococcales bacterium]
IYNITNGSRLTTYAIRAAKDSGVISVNGAAAHLANPGDLLIICAYVVLSENELAGFKPQLVYVDENNKIVRTSRTIPVQAA